MNAVLHASPETLVSALHAAPRSTPRHALCPECSQPFAPSQLRQLFCTADHKAAYHNRATVRGRVLTPLIMAARITRGGSRGDTETGKRARQDAEQLIERWVAEDRAAGRMSAVDYVALRLRKGFTLA